MSEERKLILQMVAEGKISADEAEMLLQAIDETQRTAQSAAAETVRTSTASHPNAEPDWGATIEKAVGEGLRGLDEALRGMEMHLERRTHDADRLRSKVEEKMRRATEKAIEKAREAEERARERALAAEERARERARHAEERMHHAAQRAAERAARHAEHIHVGIHEHLHADEDRPRFYKTGISIDKVTAEKQERFSLRAEPGDRLVLDNRVGDVQIEFYQGDQIEVELKKLVWGEDQADAEARSEATKVQLVRHGADAVIDIIRPVINAVGVVVLKDTRLDFTIRVPHGTHLNVYTKVGNLRVSGGQSVGTWQLATKVGDVNVRVSPEAGFYYTAQTKVGNIRVALPEASGHSGRVGDGSGNIQIATKTGDISLHT